MGREKEADQAPVLSILVFEAPSPENNIILILQWDSKIYQNKVSSP